MADFTLTGASTAFQRLRALPGQATTTVARAETLSHAAPPPTASPREMRGATPRVERNRDEREREFASTLQSARNNRPANNPPPTASERAATAKQGPRRENDAQPEQTQSTRDSQAPTSHHDVASANGGQPASTDAGRPVGEEADTNQATKGDDGAGITNQPVNASLKPVDAALESDTVAESTAVELAASLAALAPTASTPANLALPGEETTDPELSTTELVLTEGTESGIEIAAPDSLASSAVGVTPSESNPLLQPHANPALPAKATPTDQNPPSQSPGSDPAALPLAVAGNLSLAGKSTTDPASPDSTDEPVPTTAELLKKAKSRGEGDSSTEAELAAAELVQALATQLDVTSVATQNTDTASDATSKETSAHANPVATPASPGGTPSPPAGVPPRPLGALAHSAPTNPAADQGSSASAGSHLTEIERVRLIQRVARAFHSLEDQVGELRLRLSPPELGSLKLEVTYREGNLTARLEAETTAARNILMESLPQLKERLAEQNVRIEAFEVDVSDQQRSPDGQARDFADQARERQIQRNNRLPEGSTPARANLSTITRSVHAPHPPGGLNVIV
ncbi:MAG: flagellar hook-length control protein FliK [Pirellulales bacterium]|nr:flagellar hook-length control protein FliK [Pirellulales bacterium]